MTQASLASGFNGVQFTTIQKNQEPWISSAQLAAALGYSREDQVSRIYQRHAEEFTESMTQIIEISAEHHFGAKGRTRIFSLRGCHLIAMFARTPIAKEFRVWVLNVLESLNKK